MQILNRVKTQTHDIEHHDGKTYYRCCVCGRQLFRKVKSHGKVYCNKHYDQLKKYGHAIDNNPRTLMDRNEIIVNGKVARVKLYDARCNHIATAIIDADDVDKIRYTKWKLSASGYAMNAPKFLVQISTCTARCWALTNLLTISTTTRLITANAICAL